jgi:hypothetical protein
VKVSNTGTRFPSRASRQKDWKSGWIIGVAG